MINIEQQKFPIESIESYLENNEYVEIKLNKELIKRDYERLEKDLKDNKYKNKYDKENIKRLVKYLKDINGKLNNDNIIELCWNIDNNIPYTYPISLIEEKAYGINTCDYIELEDERLVEINLTDMADLISFELMYKDLGESHNSIEELLKPCGVIGYNDPNLLLNYFKDNGDRLYELSKTMRIDSTPYMYLETKKVHDYFYTRDFKTKDYREVVDYSCKYASTVILHNIITSGLSSNTMVKPIMNNSTHIAFITDNDTEINIKKKLIDSISIRLFGRRFKLEPKIQIF